MSHDVVIVGAGLAALVCAGDLARAGFDVLMLEASDGVGGRVRSDIVDGFRLDRGFQIVLTGYPQVHQRIDLRALGLRRFEPGALVRIDGAFAHIADPRRRPWLLPQTVRAPLYEPGDRAKAAALVLDVLRGPARGLLRRPDMTTAERLRAAGLSERFVRAFWRPFFAGIQLDPGLEVSARRFDIVLRTLAVGATGLPREGVGALARQLAAGLPPGTVRLEAPVSAVGPRAVTLADGERVGSRAVVVATEGRRRTRCSAPRCPTRARARPRAAGSASTARPCAVHT